MSHNSISIRQARESDRRFVVNSWFQSYRPHAGDVGFDVYSKGHRAHIEDLFLACPPPAVAVAAEDPDTILGWSLSRGDHLHYVYVKQAFRRLGIGSLLVPTGMKWYTFRTPAGLALAKRFQLRYDPWGSFIKEVVPDVERR